MSESAARAERLEFRSSNSPAYLWRVATKPVAVRLSLEVVEHMGREIQENFRSVSARGSEVGGLLLGTFLPGDPAEVLVQGYQSIPCEYARGPLYRLGELDKQHFIAAMESHQESGELSVVGFFRSHTRKGLSLDSDDMAFMESRFADPSQIALLIRPFATKTSIAGIFLWEQGVIQGETSPMEFPFSSVELEKLQPAGSSLQPKPQARAQVVPIASRRETTNIPEATIELEIPAPEVAPPVTAPAVEPAPAPASVAAVEEPPAIPAPSAPVVETAMAPASVAPPPAPAAEPLAAPSFGMSSRAKASDQQETASESGGKLKWIGAGIAAVTAAIALFVYPGFLRNTPTPSVSPAATKLSLRAERTAGDLLVIWNRDAESVRTAVKAVLTISDGPQQENLVMDLAQLRNGSVVYTPATPDVSFRLEVTSSDPAKSQSELLRVLKTPGSEASAPAKTPEPAAKTAATPTAPKADPVEAAPPVSKTPSKPFNAASVESPASRLRAARPSDLPEPPPATGGSPAPFAFSGAPAAHVAAPSAPPVTVPAPRADTKQPPLRVGGEVKPAELVSRREPVYPPLARQSRVAGAVLMEAKIGADGKVKEVKALQGHPMLRSAAIDAVKKWTYRPALLNGQPVESTSRVEVNFVGGK